MMIGGMIYKQAILLMSYPRGSDNNYGKCITHYIGWCDEMLDIHDETRLLRRNTHIKRPKKGYFEYQLLLVVAKNQWNLVIIDTSNDG